jgi:hypothetical protein
VTTPDRITLDAEDLAGLTGAELFGALAHAGLTRAGLPAALAALSNPDGDPALGLQAYRFLQGVALEFALRNGPGPTWEDAQRWDVVSTGDTRDPLVADRAEYRAAVSILAAVPLAEAESIPLGDLEALARVRKVAGA